MATPLTLAQIVAAYTEWHVPFKVYDGAGSRGRPGGITDAHGITEHHTGGGSASASYLYFLFVEGRPAEGIPGPLCNEATDLGGTVWIGAVGRANHAGMGSSVTRDHIVAEDYAGYTSELKPGPDNINGNPLYYGNEWIYSGTRPPTAAQYRGAALAAAARLDAHGWSALSILAHREHTRRKDDPFGVAMGQFRTDVKAILAAGPDKTVNYVATGKLEAVKPPTTTPPPATNGAKTLTDWTEAQLRAMMQAEEEEFAVRFWVAPSGTGTRLIKIIDKMNLQLDRIEADTDKIPAPALAAQSRELRSALQDSLNVLDSRPAAQAFAASLNTDGSMTPADTGAPHAVDPEQPA